MRNKILGVLYGMAIGDAMGMPPELWPRKKLLEVYGEITDFLDGHSENEISYQYQRGCVTDDTSQALVILDSLIETHFQPNSSNIATHLLRWAQKENAFAQNILGPASKMALELFAQGQDPSQHSQSALSNGAAMRIAPIGTLFNSSQKKALCDYVKEVSKVTHSSDITLAGACMIAIAVSSAMEKEDKDLMIEDVIAVEDYALSLGYPTISASLSTRIIYGVELAHKYKNQEMLFLEHLYNMMGAGVNTIDSIPCAIALAYYCFGDVHHCALMCANLGGDTDTIGAMASAICGGVHGVRCISLASIALIDRVNQIDFELYADEIIAYRGRALC